MVRAVGKRDFARQMRKNPSFAEIALWKIVKNRALGVTFRRQVQKHGYILDLYCLTAHLCVEVDGKEAHAGRWAYDQNRDLALQRHGIRTLRLPANLVLKAPEAAAQRIRLALGALAGPLIQSSEPASGA